MRQSVELSVLIWNDGSWTKCRILVLFNEDKVFWGNMCEAISCGLEFVLVHEIQYL